MSSDYRPRGGNSDGGSGRRRRGGRGRGPRSQSSGGEHRSHSNGSSNGTHSAPKKKQNPIAAFFSWITGGGKKPAPNGRSTSPRPEGRAHEDRGPRGPRSERSERPERSERSERPPRAERPERPERSERAERPEPEPQEIVTPKLYVGNLSYDAAESDLFDLFSKVGAVKNVEIAVDRRSNRSKGFGFVEMEVIETAKEAAEKLNRTDFMGRQIVVSGAKMERSRVNPPVEEQSTDESSSPASSSEESSL